MARGWRLFSLEAIKIFLFGYTITLFRHLNHYLDSTFNPICSRDPMMPLFKHDDAGPHQPPMSMIPSNTHLSMISKSSFGQIINLTRQSVAKMALLKSKPRSTSSPMVSATRRAGRPTSSNSSTRPKSTCTVPFAFASTQTTTAVY